ADVDSYSSAQSLAKQKNEILKAVTPRHEFSLTDALRVTDKDLAKTDVPILNCFDFNFFAEGHSVACQFHCIQCVPTKNPHPRLRVMDPPEEQQRHRDRKNRVAHLMLRIHCRVI